MAAVFTAFDHGTYQKLITQHLEDIGKMPVPIFTMFSFVVSVLEGHATWLVLTKVMEVIY